MYSLRIYLFIILFAFSASTQAGTSWNNADKNPERILNKRFHRYHNYHVAEIFTEKISLTTTRAQRRIYKPSFNLPHWMYRFG